MKPAPAAWRLRLSSYFHSKRDGPKAKALRGTAVAEFTKVAGVRKVMPLKSLPMVRVLGTRAAILTLAKSPHVRIVAPNPRVKAQNLSGTGQQEIIGWSAMLEALPPLLTSEVKIAVLEQCHPDLVNLGQTGPDHQVSYLPSNQVFQFPSSGDGCTRETKRHSNAVHSILWARQDSAFSPARGKDGLLPQYSGLVTSIAMNAMGGRLSPPGGPCAIDDHCCAGACESGRCVASCTPSLAEVCESLAEPLLSDTRVPDILSVSSNPVLFPRGSRDSNIYWHVLDWLSVVSGTLVVYASGNNGFEPHVAWDGTKDQLEQMLKARRGWNHRVNDPNTEPAEKTSDPSGGQPSSCFDELDNDGDGNIDCLDDDCQDHWSCKAAHYVIPHLRNAIVVGGADTMGLLGLSSFFHRLGGTQPASVPDYSGLPPRWQTSEQSISNSFSSWRTHSTHNDRRLPHVVAPGRALAYARSTVPDWGGPTDYYWHTYYGESLHNDPYSLDQTGTSFATPMVAALAAYALRHVLSFTYDRRKAQQIVRALVMATAENNPLTYHYVTEVPQGEVVPLTWQGSRSRLITGSASARGNRREHRDGAGGVSGTALGAVLRTSDNPGGRQWGGFTVFIPDGAPIPDPIKSDVYTPPDFNEPTRPLRVAIAWNSPENACIDPSTCSPELSPQGYDLDLCVVMVKHLQDGHPDDEEPDQVLACAASWDNNYEFLEIDVPNASFYNVVTVYSGVPNSTVTVGHALHWLPINP